MIKGAFIVLVIMRRLVNDDANAYFRLVPIATFHLIVLHSRFVVPAKNLSELNRTK